MKKVVFLAVALLAICGTAFGEYLVDLEIGTAAVYNQQSNIGGAGNHSVTKPAGWTGAIEIYIYGRATTTNTAYDDAWITSLKGSITETSNTVQGDMSWGTSTTGNTNKNKNVYSSNYPGGSPDWSAGSYPTAGTVGGDIQIPSVGIGAFAPVANGTNVEQGSLANWLIIGHITYTVKSGSGYSDVIFTPNMTSIGVSYQFGLADDGEPSTPTIGPEQGYTGSSVRINIPAVPEPSTLVMLGMACLALLAIKRRK